MLLFHRLSCSVVKFRRTGDSAYSEYECGTRDQMVQVEGGNIDAGSVALSDGAPVPQEFANPTDGTTIYTYPTNVTEQK